MIRAGAQLQYGNPTIRPPTKPEETDLCRIAMKYGCDKCPTVASKYNGGLGHSYTPYYHWLFKDKREEVKRVLEIGIDTGASLRMWKDYFPYAEIIGVDNNKGTLLFEDRISSHQCDQSSQSELETLRDAVGECDLIVDDGSHNPQHQILTCNILAAKLAIGGVYVIEDILPPPINYELVIKKITYPWKRRLFRIGPLVDDVVMTMWRKI